MRNIEHSSTKSASIRDALPEMAGSSFDAMRGGL